MVVILLMLILLQIMTVQHKFVDFIPDNIEDGIVYISLNFGTVIHNCACGCGNEVNTPLSPTAWKMIYNGESVTLKPSIGNWSFDCKSHYWITNNKIEWSSDWSDEKITKIRNSEDNERIEYYEKEKSTPSITKDNNCEISKTKSNKKRWRFLKYIFG